MARILVADDDWSIVHALRAVFEKLGHEVISCVDGLDAIALLDSQKFDGIVIDWQLGSIDGIDVLGVARQRCPKARRILVTASPNEADVRDAVREGLVEILIEKPWSISEIRAAVRGL